MKIETKFEPYAIIHFISNNKAVSSTIRGILIRISTCPQEITTDITYLCNDDGDAKVFIKVDESAAFESKELLLKSL